jgi:hypothetical protein
VQNKYNGVMIGIIRKTIANCPELKAKLQIPLSKVISTILTARMQLNDSVELILYLLKQKSLNMLIKQIEAFLKGKNYPQISMGELPQQN